MTEIIRYFTKVVPNKIIRWNGTTQQDLEDFCSEINYGPEGVTIAQDGSINLPFISWPEFIIPLGYWLVGGVIVAHENINDYITSQSWIVVEDDGPYEWVNLVE